LLQQKEKDINDEAERTDAPKKKQGQGKAKACADSMELV
jgi:hypothetical protein